MSYAKVIVKGSPISKSNFKLFNMNGRAILPYNSGKYHDRYALYEEEIAYECRVQNPGIVLSEALIAVLKVFYKSKKRHPDTNNITKSIFDGVEKSGLIVNDAQVRRLIIEEFYDEKNPRFELELFGESTYKMNYSIEELHIKDEPIEYNPPSNSKTKSPNQLKKVTSSKPVSKEVLCCEICQRSVSKENAISANKGKTILCKKCFKKLF
ncbi:RusA family crossover junction endodeoxyribonuclease [Clostridium senegalense]|uniref:RusA family crossover junction endodeoxyribonuclease n=1 Tax=Clostridium senegalense TaxID=1465809 RepID=UPI000287EAFC|nr:RusA family crossover junction endodeoxyribonuclease [Clostridium senegalense]